MFPPAVKEKIKNTWREWSISFGLVVLVLALFRPLFHADFINCDDPDYVIHNPHVMNGLTWRNVAWAFQIGTGHASNWHPLTWLSHMLDCQLFGINPGPHHAVNIFFHAANAVILFWLLRRMTSRLWESAIVAAIFALHPLRLESVAWVSERKDVLSFFFGLIAMWFYVAYVQSSRSTHRKVLYASSLILFACALMAKPMMVTLPLLFLLLDYWPLQQTTLFDRRKWTRLLVAKIPFLVLSAAACFLTLRAQTKAMVSTFTIPIGARVGNAVVASAEYLRKICWPTDLAFFYPHPIWWPPRYVIVSAIVVAVVFSVVILAVRKRPYLTVGILWFFGTLVPTLGLVQVGSQSMADRYTYIPMIGILIAMVWLVSELVRNRLFRRLIFVETLVVLASFFVLSAQLTTYWLNPIALFEHSLLVGRDNFVVRHNLGNALSNEGQFEAGMRHLRRALYFIPNSPEVMHHMANNLAHRERFNEAIEYYQRSVDAKPDAEVYYDMANTLALMFRYPESEQAFERALRIQPDYPEAHVNYGNTLLQQHKIEQAITHYMQARDLFPEMPEVHLSLSSAYALQRRWADAVSELREALRCRPDYPAACNDLAWIFATTTIEKLHQPSEAVGLAQKACSLTVNETPGFLDTLAVAYASTGRFDDAIATTQRVINICTNSNHRALLPLMSERLALFSTKRPYQPDDPGPLSTPPIMLDLKAK